MKKIQIFSISLGFLIVFLLGFGANVLFFNDDSIEVYANNNMETIVIDAGHRGYDVGCIALDGTQEKDITLDIALSTGELLEEAGYNVVYTRTSDNVSWPEDNKEDLQSRIDIAEDADANYYISIHINSVIIMMGLVVMKHMWILMMMRWLKWQNLFMRSWNC